MGSKVIITAGGTSERIDNVRKITNSSTGRLGRIIAKKLLEKKNNKIDTIYYICSKNVLKPRDNKIKIIEIESVQDLKDSVCFLLKEEKIDYFIHAMAVSDYTVDYVTTGEDLAREMDRNKEKNMIDIIKEYGKGLQNNKISSNLDNLIIKLKKTEKIISLIKKLSPMTYLVGFKLLDGVKESELIDVACKLKEKNNCNLVVANDYSNIRNGEHIGFIVKEKDNYVKAIGKEEIASKLVEKMDI